MNKKKIGIIIAVVIVVVAALAVGGWFLLGGGAGLADNGDRVYVESVEKLLNQNMGSQNRYAGVIEPQESWDVKKNPDKTVKELFVEEGQSVEVGTPLFEYDTEDIQDQIAQAKLDLESIDNDISDYNNQIKTLQEERNTVSEDEKFQYTTQIQSIQTSIKQAQYNKESKKVEIEKLETSADNSVVTSELAGVIKSISESGYDPNTGSELPYISVLAVGDFRVKGTVSEQNVWSITPGAQVLIRSRIDEKQTWVGTIDMVDTNAEVSNDNMGYYEGSSSESTTKYPFYIALDSIDGLMLGQHVYIEMDMGQEEEKEGIWLYESYVVQDEEGTYIWADNGKQRLEKRAVELGEYDENLFMYEIVSGITLDDYITYPMPALYEGVITVTDAGEVDYSSPMYMDEGTMDDDMYMDEGMMDDDMYMDEGMMDDDMYMDEGMMDDDMYMDEGMMDDDMYMDDSMMEDGAMDDGTGTGDGATEPEVLE